MTRDDPESPETRDIETADAADEDQNPDANDVDESVTESSTDDVFPRRTERQRRNRTGRLLKIKVGPAALVLLLLTSAGAATWLYFQGYQPHRQTDPSVAEAVIRAASEGTVALLSYSPESLEKDFASAKSHLSGDFLSYYNQFTDQIVAPAAKKKSLKTTAHVTKAGVSELHPNSAVVLLYVDQSTTSKDKPEPAMTASGVVVSMTRINGTWLINKFEPV